MNNFILHEKSHNYEWSGDCFLSVKSFYTGEARYSVGAREYLVNDDNFLILNECTRYQLIIDSLKLTESFCVFFSPEYVNQFISESLSTDDEQLDFSTKTNMGLNLVERNYAHQGRVSELLHYGRLRNIKSGERLEIDEYNHELLNLVFVENRSTLNQCERLDMKKKSTRMEILKRVYFAKDFIESNYTDTLTLNEIANASMLSENHLIRNFKSIFGHSPFQYVSKLRILKAIKLLKQTNLNISEIANSLGYSSLGNFSYFFKKEVGASPTDLRKGDI